MISKDEFMSSTTQRGTRLYQEANVIVYWG